MGVTDIEQLKATKADKLEIASVVDRCEKGVSFMALEIKEQADMLLKPQLLGEFKARGEVSPSSTIETQISEAWCQSNSDESWYADNDELLLGNDHTSEHEIEGWNR